MRFKKFKDILKWADGKNYKIEHITYAEPDSHFEDWEMTKETELYSVRLCFNKYIKKYELDFESKNVTDGCDEWCENYGFENLVFKNARELQEFLRAITRTDRSFTENNYEIVNTERNRKDWKIIEKYQNRD